jgi:tetratricopeptide (TPR) repeat protein
MAKRKRQRSKRKVGRKGPVRQDARISVCMIARDEGAFLARCLESIGDHAHEILVGDTGSTDNTREVARAAGAKVLTVPWIDDFSKARNVVISRAKGDWILVLDCDEVVSEQDWDVIRKTALSGRAVGYRMTTRNYTSSSDRAGWRPCKGEYREETDYSGWFPTTKVRLFKKSPRIRFEGALHELVESSIEASGGTIADCLVPIHHYGYVEKDRSGKMTALYLDAAECKAAQDTENPKAKYELALARRDSGKLEEARSAIQECIDQMKTSSGKVDPYLRLDYAYLIKGDILGRIGDPDGARECCREALAANPQCHEALNNLGTALLRDGDLEAARDHYQRALAIAPEMEAINKNLEKVDRALAARSKPEPADSHLPTDTSVTHIPDFGVEAANTTGLLREEAKRGGDIEPAKARLSLCMIVRNEEERLGRCLECVQGLVDEIVVVDTGSTDGTVAVAERFGAKMGYFEWCDDFSAARNESIKLASGDWILWLDADDLLPSEYHDQIRNLIATNQKKAYLFVLDSQGCETVACLQTRLFPNVPGAEFEKPVHEQLAPSMARLGIDVEPTGVRVVHTGYTTKEVVRGKMERYLRIMERWLEDHPGDYVVRSNVAMTYFVWGELNTAIGHYENILHESNCKKDRNLVIETTSWLYLGRCYMRKGDCEKGLTFLLEALKLDDQYAVTNVTLGECYLKMEKAQESLQALDQAQKFEDQLTFSANDPIALKYWIRFFKAQNFESLGRLDEALNWFRLASEVNPARSDALGAMSTVYRKAGRMAEAVEALERALEIEPNDARHRFNRGTFYLEEGRTEAAEEWLRSAIEVDPGMPGPYLNLGIVARRKGDLKIAEEMYRLAIAREKKSYEPLANLGHLLLDQERFPEAGEVFERIRTFKTGLLDVDLGLCVAHAASGDIDGVRGLTVGILKGVYGSDTLPMLPDGVSEAALAQLFAESGRKLLTSRIVVCARLAYLIAHLLDEDSIEFALQLAEVFRASGEIWRAIPIYEKIIRSQPTDPGLFKKLGQCYQDMGAPEAAQLCEDQVVALAV